MTFIESRLPNLFIFMMNSNLGSPV